jgi:IS30 family transposase
MPGNALCAEEREEIRLGLAEGLAFAELARLLRRPTSTVSREVCRNGGRRATQAWQQATGRPMRPDARS